jgi:two-component system NtrC family sensor kinase
VVLTIYFFIQHGNIVEEGRILRLRAVAEGQANTLDLFLAEREENLANLMYNQRFDIPPSLELMEAGLEGLRRDSEAFVDLGFIDEWGLQVAYAGPYRSLKVRNYGSARWYIELKNGELNHQITDIHLGFRDKPHFTIAVKRTFENETVVLKASLEPSEIYEYLSSWGEARDVEISIVNRQGYRQTMAGDGAALQASPAVPPESSHVGTVVADVGGE